MRCPLRIALVLVPLGVALPSLRAALPEEEAMEIQHPQALLDAVRGSPEWGAVPIFFPPEPPPLDEVEANVVPETWGGARRLWAPPELAGYTGEPFYPALSTILALNDLSRWGRRRIEDYRAVKLRLQAELRLELANVREFPAEARRERLRAFAQEQNPKIRELEAEAERLRSSFVKIDYRWGELRTEWLGKDRHSPDSAELIADVMRAAAYYEGGLLPAQRRFLREIAIEVPLVADTVEAALSKQPYVFFSPSLARVRLPEDLPVGLARKLARYQERRSALKKALFDAVFKADSTWLSVVRSVQFRINLGPQREEIDQIEELAEEIRWELAQLPESSSPSGPVPAESLRRIGAVLESERALRTHFREAIDAVRRRETGLDVAYAFQTAGLEFDVRARPRFFAGLGAETKGRAKAVQAEIAGLALEYRRGLQRLAQERVTARTELAAALGLADTSEIDAAEKGATRAAVRAERDGPFRAYHAAVFEPGLSPEQRRLLFDSAIDQLGLPLPTGGYQPQQ